MEEIILSNELQFQLINQEINCLMSPKTSWNDLRSVFGYLQCLHAVVVLYIDVGLLLEDIVTVRIRISEAITFMEKN